MLPNDLLQSKQVEGSDQLPYYREIFDRNYVSPKLKALLERVRIELAQGHKCVIASQWVQALDIVEEHIRRDYTYSSLTGRVRKAVERQARAKAFNEPNSGPQIMLLSVGAGGVSITLTGASRFFLLEPHFNPAKEQQAFDRIHRIGQTKETKIYKLIVNNTIEQRVMSIQLHKISMAQRVFERNGKEDAKSRIAILQELFDLP
ncbi:SNF2 family N-terminal domain containing protein [Aphelenchoides avenae]|nr:SNF2 family N-terminal domain containing protein [Aphelenchus avenae]